VLHYLLGGFFSAAVGQGAGEDERFAGELLAFEDALFGGRAEAGFIELFDYFLVGGFGKEFGYGGGYLRAYLGYFEELVFFGFG
jgi:hypothetical protein